MGMTVSQAIHDIPEILPVAATVAAAVVAAIYCLFTVLKRARLVEKIKKTELELNQARARLQGSGRAAGDLFEGLHDAAIVGTHDKLVKYRQVHRRAKVQVQVASYVLLPLLVGGFLGIGHIMRTIEDLDNLAQVSAQFQELEHEVDVQASVNTQMAAVVKEYVHEREALQDRLMMTEEQLASERKEKRKLEVLLGKAEQRVAGLEESLGSKSDKRGLVISEEPMAEDPEDNPEAATIPTMSAERAFEESDLSADSPKLSAVDGTSHYTGTLEGQIAFEGKPKRSKAGSNSHHIYVLVRWGVSSWIVADSLPTVNPDGAVEGEFTVILPISTIRTLDVTAIATNKVYRRYQRVRFLDYEWKTSAATVPVHRS